MDQDADTSLSSSCSDSSSRNMSIWNSDDILRTFRKVMENESEIVADQEIFAEEKLSDDKILSINIKIKERLAVKLVRLTPAQIEELTTNIRQTKITSYFKRTHVKESLPSPAPDELLEERTLQTCTQEFDNENLPILPSTSLASSKTYKSPLPKKPSEEIYFARKSTNQTKRIRRKRSRDSDYGSLSNRSFSMEMKEEFDETNNNRPMRQTRKTRSNRSNDSLTKPSSRNQRRVSRVKDIHKIISYEKVQDKILFEVEWKNSLYFSNTWEPIEFFKGTLKFNDFLNNEFDEKVEELKEFYDDYIKENADKFELESKNREKDILKELRTFNIEKFNRILLLSMILTENKVFSDSTSIEELRKQCHLKYFYDKKKSRDKETSNLLSQIRADNPAALIYFENYMDFEPLKLDFKYISKNFSGKGVKIPQVAEVECCSCADTCSGKWECCSNRKKQSLVYDKNKCFTKVGDYSEAIYECNSLCKCGPDCLNRVVQLGSKASLCFFKSADKTLKVKTLRSIRRGQFISEYVGEIISPAAAQKVRSKNEGDLDFVIDMSFYKSHNPYAIDATNFGNAMRILGHSETPNCAVYSVWYDCNDERFPKLAYFALKYIRTGAELTMDYTGGVYVEPAEEDVDEEYDSKSESE